MKKNKEIISVKNACKHVILDKKNDVKKTILDDINLNITQGEFVVIYGESGSGKTSLLSIISALEKPDSGSVIINDHIIQDASQKELTKIRKENIGFVFQQYGLLNDLTVKDNILLNLRTSKFQKDLVTITKQLGIYEKLNVKVKLLSGGQKQRVSIARAIIRKPLILFADEPTGAVDYETGLEIIKIFKELNATQNITVIMVTHNKEFLTIGNRLIEMSDGKIIQDSK